MGATHFPLNVLTHFQVSQHPAATALSLYILTSETLNS